MSIFSERSLLGGRHQTEQKEIGFGTGQSNFTTSYDAYDEDIDSFIANTPVDPSMKQHFMTQQARVDAQDHKQRMTRYDDTAAEGDDMAGVDFGDYAAPDPDDIIARTKADPAMRDYYGAWNKRRDAIQGGLDSGNLQDFDDTIALIRANKNDPKFGNMLHPQTRWMYETYETDLKNGKTPEQAREAAYEVGAYRYMDEEIMGSLNKAGQEIKAGASTLWGADANARAYEKIKNNSNIPDVYKQRILTKIAGNGTDMAIDAMTTFTPVGRVIGATRSFGKGRLEAAEHNVDFWGQVGGGLIHTGTDAIMGKAARQMKKGVDASLADSNPMKRNIKRVSGTLINIGQKETERQTKKSLMDWGYNDSSR